MMLKCLEARQIETSSLQLCPFALLQLLQWATWDYCVKTLSRKTVPQTVSARGWQMRKHVQGQEWIPLT